MKNITKSLGTGLLTLLAGCAGLQTQQIEPKPVANQTITLTPKERVALQMNDQFMNLYELALKAHDAYSRNKNGGAVDSQVAESSLADYKSRVGELGFYIQSIKDRGLDANQNGLGDTTRLEQIMSTLPK